MTTVAYDGHSLVADTQSTIGGIPLSRESKLLAVKRGSRVRLLMGMSGQAPLAMELVRQFVADWHNIRQNVRLARGPGIPDSGDGASVIAVVIRPDDAEGGKTPHRAYLLTRDGSISDITGQPWAIGSGSEFAMGAMDAGAKALAAVRIAIARDVYSGGTPTAYRIEDFLTTPLDQFTEVPL